MGAKEHAEQVVRNIRRRTRKQYSAEEKIRIVLEGLRGEETILCWLLGLEPMTRPAITGIAIAGNSVLGDVRRKRVGLQNLVICGSQAASRRHSARAVERLTLKYSRLQR